MKVVWDFFNSVKLTVYLVLAIVALTVFGSLVLYVHPEVFGDMDHGLFFPWLFSKGLLFPKYTWWLYLLVALVIVFGVNTFVCTVERLPKLIKRYNSPLMNLRDIGLGGEKGRELAVGGDRLEDALIGAGYKVFKDGGRLYAEKNRWLPFIPYAVHIGIIMFLIAHFISGVSGYRNSGVQIFEGEAVKSPGGDYFLRLESFKVDYRSDGSLKDYGSELTAIKDGKVIKKGRVSANSPMFVEGGAVYQREFGQDFRGIVVYLDIKSAGFSNYIVLPRGSHKTDIPGTPYTIAVDEFIPDFAVGPDGQPFSQSDELANPVMHATLLKDGRPRSGGWLFLRSPGQDTFRDGDVRMRMSDLSMKNYSTFDINRDPSAILMLVASCIVMFGSVVTLYFRRERVWATVEGDRAQVVCTDEDVYERLA